MGVRQGRVRKKGAEMITVLDEQADEGQRQQQERQQQLDGQNNTMAGWTDWIQEKGTNGSAGLG